MYQDQPYDEGLFLAALYDFQSCSSLQKYAKAAQIPLATPVTGYHTTIVHSCQNVDFAPVYDLDIIIPKEDIRLDHFDNDYGRVLVLRVEHPYLHERYQQSLQAGAVVRHNKFRPHITLSQNIGDWDYRKVPPVDFDLRITGEYSQPLLWAAY